ncbi:hypothetical protein BDV19DRAFT_352291 [Aspergillus venezuelensis]
MGRYSSIWLVYLAITLFSPQTLAWTFLWRNETTNSHIENGQSAQNCTQAWHQEGEQFSWDPEGTWCLKLYSDTNCEHTNGIACEPYLWRKDASQNISAFLVYPMPPSSITAFGLDSTTSATPTLTPTPTTASTTTPSDAVAEETPTSEADLSNDIELSGGAIAGIVVGAVAAVAILCVAFFFLGLRNRKKSAAAAAAADSSDSNTRSTEPSSPHSENPSSNATLFDTGPMVAELPKPPFVEMQYVPEQATHTQPPNGVRMMELPGNEPGHELSNSAQVQEMLGTTQVQELEGEPMDKRKL